MSWRVVLVAAVFAFGVAGDGQARDSSKGGGGKAAHPSKAAAEASLSKPLARPNNPPSAIVMGRSISPRHNSKLHHAVIPPLDLADSPSASEHVF